MNDMYDDIIDLPHHVSLSRPRMSIRDRAAQFAPFSALTGYDAIVSEEGRLTNTRIELDEYEKMLINDALVEIINRINELPRVRIMYFEPDERKSGGEYVSYEGNVMELDEYEKKITFEDGKIVWIDELISITFIKEN